MILARKEKKSKSLTYSEKKNPSQCCYVETELAEDPWSVPQLSYKLTTTEIGVVKLKYVDII